jgi:hypothetical protein
LSTARRSPGSSFAHSAPQDSRRHASAGVADAELQPRQLALGRAAQLDPHPTPLSPIEAGAEERQENLLDPTRVADDHAWNVELSPKRKIETLGPGRLGNEPEAGLDARPNVEGMQRQLELATLDDRGIEHPLDQPGDLLGSNLDDRCKLAFFGGRCSHRQQAGGAKNGVELVAELVTEIGQQLAVDFDALPRYQLAHDDQPAGGTVLG